MKKSLMENFIFCAVYKQHSPIPIKKTVDYKDKVSCLYFYFHCSTFGSSHLQIFFKIGVFKNFANFTGKHLRWSLFLIKLKAFKPATLLKRDSNTGVFPWILRNNTCIEKHLRKCEVNKQCFNVQRLHVFFHVIISTKGDNFKKLMAILLEKLVIIRSILPEMFCQKRFS